MRISVQRNRRGSVLVLGCICFGFLALLTLIGCSFANLYFVCNRVQTSADEIALAGAHALNEHDQIGQMNNMIVRCRQLVYTSQQDYDNVVADYPHLQTLARELRDSDRQSATTLEGQRTLLRDLAIARAQVAMENKFNQIKPSYSMVLPWARTDMSALIQFRFGRLAGTESNVGELAGVSELASIDHTRGYIQAAAGSMGLSRYRQGIDAKLPDANSDLSFNVSSLAAPVSATVSPARITQAGAFAVVLPGTQIPSAVQVKVTLNVATGIGPHGSGHIVALGTAATTGGDRQL